MTEGQNYSVKCQICNKEFDGIGAFVHTKTTGHNRWEILMEKKGGKVSWETQTDRVSGLLDSESSERL